MIVKGNIMNDINDIKNLQIKILSTKQACDILKRCGLHTDPQKLGLGLQQGVYPFGIAIKDKHWTYEIYENLLIKWIKERSS